MLQLISARTARGLDRNSLNDRYDVASEIGGVGIDGQIAVRDRTLEALA